MAWSRGYTVKWRPPSCAMAMNTGPKLFRWSCWGFAVRGRRTWKPHQPNWFTFVSCGYRGNSSPFPSPNTLTSRTSRPGWRSTLETFAPYQLPSMLRHPSSFSRTWPPPRMSFYARCPRGSPPSPVCPSIQGPPQERQDLHHRGPGCCKDGLHWPPKAGVRPPCWHRINSTTGHSFHPHDSLWTTGTLSGLPGVTAVSAGGVGGVDTAG